VTFEGATDTAIVVAEIDAEVADATGVRISVTGPSKPRLNAKSAS
jgi:hypothetical protein